jgi:hypothetical protein
MTDKSQRKRFYLLKSLLRPLIEEWGRETLLRAISEISGEETVEREERSTDKDRSTLKSRKVAQRPSAISMVDKASVSDAKRRLLLDIAAQFDRKAFLPTISDVRHFLVMRGEDAGNLSSRPEAFRKVIKVIADLPDESLQQLARSHRHSGPSQLRSLSQAIKATRGRHRANSDFSQIDQRDVPEQLGPFLPEESADPSQSTFAEDNVASHEDNRQTDRDRRIAIGNTETRPDRPK